MKRPEQTFVAAPAHYYNRLCPAAAAVEIGSYKTLEDWSNPAQERFPGRQAAEGIERQIN